MPTLNAIVLSNTKSNAIYQMTLDCIKSLMNSEKDSVSIQIDVVLIESNREYKDQGFIFPEDIRVVVPEENFNFHKYLNIGIQLSNHDYVALCNNDLIFHKNWFTEILKIKNKKPEILSFSPLDPDSSVAVGLMCQDIEYQLGYKVREHVAGWCLVAHNTLFDKIGLLDERFDFYYADDDYSMTLKRYNISNALVAKSHVSHLGGRVTQDIKDRKISGLSTSQGLQKFENLPKYLLSEEYRWILKNEKMLEAHLKFHQKWGNRKVIALKDRMHKILNNLNQGWLIKMLYTSK